MARDEAAAGDRAVPELISAAWEIACSSGPWWPFSRSAVISDRPIEMHLNDDSQLHRSGGPAAEYRDGARLWAWNGHAMREEWIMHPESISARDLKEFDSTFREYAAARSGILRRRPRVKTSSILERALEGSIEDRIGVLRKHNKNQLPLHDRYLAGEYEKVWSELIALGPSVRGDPNTADALAVAYETMRRVDANVRRISAELQALEYHATSDLHTLPGPTVHGQLARLERKAGVLPLSIRAFYEIVGAVDWTGEHQGLVQAGDTVAPDPLVVFPVEDLVAQCEAGFGGGEVLAIAPDDLHKCNASGGEPYEIEIPNVSADGKVLNERHDLYFVEYLRLVFRFGGFPGYDGVDRAVPLELTRLRSNMIPF
jgi:hypothetical protein